MHSPPEASWSVRLEEPFGADEELTIAFGTGDRIVLRGDGGRTAMFAVGSPGPASPHEDGTELPRPFAPDDVVARYDEIRIGDRRIEFDWIDSWAVSRDRSLLAVIERGDLRLLPLDDRPEGRLRLTLEDEAHHYVVAFDPTGTRVAISDGLAIAVLEVSRLLELSMWRGLRFDGGDEYVLLEFSRLGGEALFTGATEIGIWRFALASGRGEEVPGTRRDGVYGMVQVAPDGAALIWNAPDGLELRPLSEPAGEPIGLSAGDGRARAVFGWHEAGALVAVGAESGGHSEVELRLLPSFELVARFAAQTGVVAGAFSADGGHLAWYELGGQVQLWQLGEVPLCVAKAELSPGALRDWPHLVVASATGAWFVANSGVVHHLSGADGALSTWHDPGVPDQLVTGSASPGGRLLALPRPGRIQVWDLANKTVVCEVGARGGETALLGDGHLVLVDSGGPSMAVFSDERLRDSAPAPIAAVRPAHPGPYTAYVVEEALTGLSGEALTLHAQLVDALMTQQAKGPNEILGEQDPEELELFIKGLARMLHAWASTRRGVALTAVVSITDHLLETPPRELRHAVRAIPEGPPRVMDSVEELDELLDLFEPEDIDQATVVLESLFGERFAEAIVEAGEGLRDQQRFEHAYRQLWPLGGSMDGPALARALRKAEGVQLLAWAVLADHLVGERDPTPLRRLADDPSASSAARAVAVATLSRWGHAPKDIDSELDEVVREVTRWALLHGSTARILR